MAYGKRIRGNNALKENQNRVITIEAAQRSKDFALRVAAYCRVSTDSLDQMNSFEAQRTYYTELISSKENWQMVDVYADPGVSGTSAKKRKDFQRLLADCRRGKIDRILVKSISRFARNTRECLEIVRELKGIGVSVVFEEQAINTGEMTGEMLTSVFAAIAQKESESISQRCRWGVQYRMQNGLFNTCNAPFGFRLVDGKLVVCEDEAVLVRRIYEMYLNGAQAREIVAQFKQEGACPESWNWKSIEYILKNERYAGNALLQKRYSTDTLPPKKARNRGERAMYFVEGCNDAIVSQEVFDLAQQLRKSRSHPMVPNPRPLSGWMVCGCCGKSVGPKSVNGKRYMACRTHEENKALCPIQEIPEIEIERAACRLYYNLKHHGEILNGMLDRLLKVKERQLLWRPEIIEQNKILSDLSCQNQLLAELKKQGFVDPDIFISKRNALAEQIRTVRLNRERMLSEGNDQSIPVTRAMIDALEDGPDYLDKFDGDVFGELIDKIIVDSGEQLRFRMKNGLELVENIERTKR